MISIISFVVNTDMGSFLSFYSITNMGLVIFNLIPVLYQDLLHDAVKLRLDLVHQLHRLHNSEYLAFFHNVPYLDKRIRIRRRRRVEGSHQRTLHNLAGKLLCLRCAVICLDSGCLYRRNHCCQRLRGSLAVPSRPGACNRLANNFLFLRMLPDL